MAAAGDRTPPTPPPCRRWRGRLTTAAIALVSLLLATLLWLSLLFSSSAPHSAPLPLHHQLCSGRISLLLQPWPSPSSAAAAKKKKKAGGVSWLLVSHDPADPDAVVGAVFDAAAGEGEVVFRFEPFIVAVECRDVASAQWLVSTAIACGFRESGLCTTL